MQPIDALTESTLSPLPGGDDLLDKAKAAPVVAFTAGPAEALSKLLDEQKRTFDIAMAASNMGTWRYTIADNICVYDENAQRLYGLTQPRFLHDEEGVKSKFHPDDLELMWSRVARAVDPLGDGRYDVEYRVRQLDGSWRWLSAWGLVEFEGEGANRRPVAITGASRDLTERKEREALQRLLLNELKHRVKNTLATIQAITSQTLSTARDLPSASEALEHRLISMAKAHDLLIARSWELTGLDEVVASALEPFSPGQVQISGCPVDVEARQTLALSMGLHELATNATKYGALSCPEGRVSVHWTTDGDRLLFDWEESGGPPVSPPSEKGFGSKMLERLLTSELGGNVTLDYAPTGLKCRITAQL